MSRGVWSSSLRACVLGLGALAFAIPSSAQSPTDSQRALDAVYGKFRTLNEGKNADYIPALAKVDPALFGIALITADGSSPPVDDAGNSARAQRALADISPALNDNPSGATAAAPAQAEPKSTFEIYGFAMLDIGYNFDQINPNWFDTLRVTRLPSFEDEFCCDGSTFAGVRQSRLGFRSSTPTSIGELKTIFEFELFGTGVDEGQTTFRLRHAWGELGAIGAGQYWSPFSDPDVYPNTLEYWGPTGIPWYRNVQLRYTPVRGANHNLMLALARPGASGDQGLYSDRIELQGIRARFPLPDFAAAYKYTKGWGYVRTAGMLRRIKWDDTLDDAFELGGDATGWGWNVSSSLKFGDSDVLRMQVTIGEGIQNEMNDSPVDIGIENNLSNPVTPLLGKPIPIVAYNAFLDHTWSTRFSTAVGYSYQDNDNTDGQAPNAFKIGQYALANLLYYPVPNVMMGGELQWGQRENFSDGFKSEGFKIQFSFKYNFSWKLGG